MTVVHQRTGQFQSAACSVVSNILDNMGQFLKFCLISLPHLSNPVGKQKLTVVLLLCVVDIFI